jgi:hypothetical protein
VALPGVTTIIKDQFYSLNKATPPTGPQVCVIAGRNTASGTGGVIDLDPYRIFSEQQAINAFGAGSQAHRAYLELVAGGCSNIVIVALPSFAVDADLVKEGNVTDARGTGVLNITDSAFQAAQTAQPDIIVPWGRGGHPLDWTLTSATPNAYLFDATPGNNTSVPAAPAFGYYADMTSQSGIPMVTRIAQLTAGITSSSSPCFSIMGVRPYVGIGANAMQNVTAAELQNYLAFTNFQSISGVYPLATLAANKSVMGMYGPYVSVVVGESTPVTYPFDQVNGIYDWGYSNSACAYAATCQQLSAWIAPTGKQLSNISAVRYNPAHSQLASVDNMNLVPLALNFSNVPYWVDAPTFSLVGSDYARLTTMRVIFAAVQSVRQISLQFVGQPASLNVQNAFQTAISSALRGMITLGALNAADFNVSFQPAQNSAEVDLVLTPAFEIRSVTLSVSVNF